MSCRRDTLEGTLAICMSKLLIEQMEKAACQPKASQERCCKRKGKFTHPAFWWERDK